MIEPLRRRVLLVDDSPFVRRAFRRVLKDVPDVEVVGEAADGLEAMQQVPALRPDVVLLDLGMPGLDGLTVLERLRANHPGVAVVVVSAATQAGAAATVRALESGAFDVVDKSTVSLMEMHSLKDALVERIRAARSRPATPPRTDESLKLPGGKVPSLICIGASTGGPQAIGWIAERLPESLPCPVLVVQHISPSFVPAFATRLDQKGKLPASVARPGEALQEGRLYVAPGGVDLELERDGEVLRARVRPAPANALHAPRIDALFHSAARIVGAHALGILLTGMGRDGAEGLLAMRAAGAFTICEHSSTCAVYGMPRAAVELGAASSVLPLHSIPKALAALVIGPANHAAPSH